MGDSTGSRWRRSYKDKALLLPHHNPGDMGSLERCPTWGAKAHGIRSHHLLVEWRPTFDSGPALKSLQSQRMKDTHPGGASHGKSTC